MTDLTVLSITHLIISRHACRLRSNLRTQAHPAIPVYLYALYDVLRFYMSPLTIVILCIIVITIYAIETLPEGQPRLRASEHLTGSNIIGPPFHRVGLLHCT